MIIGLFSFFLTAAAQPPASFLPLPRCESETAEVIAPCTVRTHLSRAAIDRLLQGREQVRWLSGDRLTLVARFGPERWGLLCCALQTPLEPIGDSGMGAITVRIPRVDEALLDAGMIASETAYPVERVPTPSAPMPPPRATTLRGTITRHVIRSSNLGQAREIQVYVPAAVPPGARLPVIFLTDGETERFAGLLEGAARGSGAAGAILVGIAPASGTLPGCKGMCDRRALEYLMSAGDDQSAPDSLFNRHLRFVADEVVPLVIGHYPASSKSADHIAAGYSNGGAWAVSAAELRPDVFGGVVAMSVAGGPWPAQHASSLKGMRVYAGAGTFERFFLPRTREVAASAQAAGAEVKMDEIVSGHSSLLWDALFAHGLPWVLAWSTTPQPR